MIFAARRPGFPIPYLIPFNLIESHTQEVNEVSFDNVTLHGVIHYEYGDISYTWILLNLQTILGMV